MKDKDILLWLNNSIKGSRRIILVLIIVQSIGSFVNVINAWYLHSMIDAVVIKDFNGLTRNAIAILIIALIWLISGAINRYLSEYGRAEIENKLKSKLISEIMHRDYAKVSDVHSQNWMNKITSDTSIVANGVITILPNLISMLVQLVSAIYMMFKIMPLYSNVLIPCGIALVIATYFFRQKIKVLHNNVQESDATFRAFISEHIENLMIVKAFSKERNVEELADQKMNDHKYARMKRAIYSDISNVGFGIIMRGAYVLCLIMGALEIYNGNITYGSFIATIQLIGQIQMPFIDASSYIPRYYTLLSSVERIMSIEQYDMDILDNNVVNDFRTIELKHVTFNYPSKDEYTKQVVFENLNLKINKNDFIAFVGQSGSGKSTVLKILMSLYPIEEGQKIIVDKDKNRRELSSRDRSLFAYVPQGNQLMSGSIKDVVTFNNADKIDLERFEMALKTACAYDFIQELDNKYDYILGEKGKGLSEGQIQRLAIARAIYSNKPILLLDEVTSSLDSKTELKLLKNLRKLNNKTVIIVTHRNTALDYCDTIIEF